MGRVSLDKIDLERHLSEQLEFIKRSIEAFDQGQTTEAKRIATRIRLLVHDTNKSTSLLAQLSLKELAYLDAGVVPDPQNLLTTTGLTTLSRKDSKWVYRPRFQGNPSLKFEWTHFDPWWTRHVLVDDQQVGISRQDLVLTMANQDGGAHVDPMLNPIYARLQRQNSAGWSTKAVTGRVPVLGVEFASVRHVAWEILQTLEYRHLLPNSK